MLALERARVRELVEAIGSRQRALTTGEVATAAAANAAAWSEASAKTVVAAAAVEAVVKQTGLGDEAGAPVAVDAAVAAKVTAQLDRLDGRLARLEAGGTALCMGSFRVRLSTSGGKWRVRITEELEPGMKPEPPPFAMSAKPYRILNGRRRYV